MNGPVANDRSRGGPGLKAGDRQSAVASLAAGMAHELNTPLGAIHSNHDVIRRALARLQDILADEVVTPDELNDVRRVVRALDGVLGTNDLAVRRMRELVDNLRRFDAHAAERVSLNICDVIEDTVRLLHHRLEGITVVREFQEVEPVECGPGRLHQVVANILVNAAQAVREQGGQPQDIAITVDTAPSGMVRTSFRDTGPGIPERVLDRVFEPGFTTKGDRVGMGIGLSVCRDIIEGAAGEIVISNGPNGQTPRGAKVTVLLPPARKAHEEESP